MRIEGFSISSLEPGNKLPEASKQLMNNSDQTNGAEENTPDDKKRNEFRESGIIQKIEEANEKFIVYDRRFEFSVHEKTKEIMIKVIDAKTDKVIREIPPEKILDMVAKLCELAGIFVDEKV